MVVAAALCGALLGVAALSFKASDGSYPLADIVLDGASGFLWLAAGTLAHLRRPANRVGLVMVAVGIGWFAEDLQLSGIAAVFTLGLLLTAASSGFLVHLVLAFPTGQLTSRPQRLLAATAYLTVSALVPFAALFTDRSGLGAPSNLLLIRYDTELLGVLVRMIDAVGVVVAVGVVAVLVRRWVMATPPMRRVVVPVFVTGLVGGVASLAGNALGPDHPLDEVALGVYKLTIVALPLGFLAGVLRVRLGRTAVSTMLGELSRAQSPAGLRDLLARTLGDPSLQVGYWRAEVQGFVDGDGQSLPVPLDRAVTVVEWEGRRVAVLVHDEALREDPHVLQAVTAAAGLALDNQRLAAEVRAQLAEVRESRARIVAAGDAARRRLERDLHDGAQQRLVTAALGLRLAEQKLGPDADPQLRALLTGSADGLNAALAELRELARGIHPAILTEAGLLAAIDALAARCPIPVDLIAPALPRLPDAVEATAYFVVAEALTNVAKHAHARQVRITVAHGSGELLVQVQDDGAGSAEINAGSGLQGLQDRVAAVDGELTVTSAPGAGTSVVATLPCGGAR